MHVCAIACERACVCVCVCVRILCAFVCASVRMCASLDVHVFVILRPSATSDKLTGSISCFPKI